MLRPVGSSALRALLGAAAATDTALDLALLRLDVLPPADLTEIRTLLSRPDITLTAATNTDGHREISVMYGGHEVAHLRHDGTVTAPTAAAA